MSDATARCLLALEMAVKDIRRYLDGDYENPRRHRGNTMKCDHGIFYWEACEQCIDAHFANTLANIETLMPESKNWGKP